MPRRNWFSSASKDSYGLNFFGWTRSGRKSKKMNAKVYRDGRTGGNITKTYGRTPGGMRLTDVRWETAKLKIRRKK